MKYVSGFAILHSKKLLNMNIITQNNRLLSIDLARGLAVLFMISVHTLEVFGNADVKNSIFGQLIEFLGSTPAAPVFMTLMGFSFIYSKKSGLKPKLWRGFLIFLSGYILNIFRGVIPFMVSSYLKLDFLNSFPTDKINEYTLLTDVDILQFAGLALMIMAIIQELKINKNTILLMAFLISMVSPFFWGIHVNIPIIDFFLDLFWGDQPVGFGIISNRISFPVFPWLTFPLMGMYLGETMKNSTNQNLTFKQFGIIGVLVLFIGLGISCFNFDYHFNDYYHSRQGAMIYMCGFVVLWIYITKLIIDILPMNNIFELLFKWSGGVTTIYFSQWILINWSIPIFGFNKCNYITFFVLIFVFTIISHFINEFLNYKKNKAKHTLLKT